MNIKDDKEQQKRQETAETSRGTETSRNSWNFKEEQELQGGTETSRNNQGGAGALRNSK